MGSDGARPELHPEPPNGDQGHSRSRQTVARAAPGATKRRPGSFPESPDGGQGRSWSHQTATMATPGAAECAFRGYPGATRVRRKSLPERSERDPRCGKGLWFSRLSRGTFGETESLFTWTWIAEDRDQRTSRSDQRTKGPPVATRATPERRARGERTSRGVENAAKWPHGATGARPKDLPERPRGDQSAINGSPGVTRERSKDHLERPERDQRTSRNDQSAIKGPPGATRVRPKDLPERPKGPTKWERAVVF